MKEPVATADDEKYYQKVNILRKEKHLQELGLSIDGRYESKRKVNVLAKGDKKSFPKNATTGYDGKLIKFEQPAGLLN